MNIWNKKVKENEDRRKKRWKLDSHTNTLWFKKKERRKKWKLRRKSQQAKATAKIWEETKVNQTKKKSRLKKDKMSWKNSNFRRYSRLGLVKWTKFLQNSSTEVRQTQHFQLKWFSLASFCELEWSRREVNEFSHIAEFLLRMVDKSQRNRNTKKMKKMHFRSSERLKDKNKIIPQPQQWWEEDKLKKEMNKKKMDNISRHRTSSPLRRSLAPTKKFHHSLRRDETTCIRWIQVK